MYTRVTWRSAWNGSKERRKRTKTEKGVGSKKEIKDTEMEEEGFKDE